MRRERIDNIPHARRRGLTATTPLLKRLGVFKRWVAPWDYAWEDEENAKPKTSS